MPKIAIGCDHAGLALKLQVMQHPTFESLDVEWLDVGTGTSERVDYPDYAHKVCQAVTAEKAQMGILMCGTGIGMCIAANRTPGIRAAMIYSDATAALAREHNDANVACFGGRTQGSKEVCQWLEIFLQTPFSGGRHIQRVRKIEDLS